MAIATLDGVIGGMRPPEEILKVGSVAEAVGVFHSHFYSAGRPGAAAAPSPGVAGEALTAYDGQIPFVNPGSGNTYLARLAMAATTVCSVILADRLWQNSGIILTTTGTQGWTPVAIPARDRDGGTDGEGVMAGIEVSSATGNGGNITNTTISYTNQAGTAGRTGTVANFPATAVAGFFVPIALQAGDTGIRSIESIALGTSYVSGAIHLVLYRPLARLSLPVANVGSELDALTGGFVRCYDNTVPFLLQGTSLATATTLVGQVIFTQG